MMQNQEESANSFCHIELESSRARHDYQTHLMSLEKEVRVGQATKESALPRNEMSFIRFFPYVMFVIFKQPQILYFIFICFILYFQSCPGIAGTAAIQGMFVFFYITLEVFGRYFSYREYTKRIYHDDEEYRLWSWKKMKWVKIKEENIKVGQIVKISGGSQSERKKIRVPVHLLPLAVESKSREVKIDTFYIDKKEGTTSIEILPQFRKKLTDAHNIEKDIQSMRIQYTFHSPISESFQAKLMIEQQSRRTIDNTLTIPKGAYSRNEEYLIGLVMHSLEENTTKHLGKVLSSGNRIDYLLQRHLFWIIFVNFIACSVYLIINVVWQTIVLGDTLQGTQDFLFYACYVSNMLSNLYYSVNVFMFFMLSLRRLIDSIKIRNKCDIKMKNYIKAIDQFGTVDTLVMDQFSIVRKNMLRIGRDDVTINEEIHGIPFDRESVLFCVHRSKKFQTRFKNEWRAINNLMEAEPISISPHDITIEEEVIDHDGSIIIVVVFNRFVHNPTQNSRFMVRFNQKIIFSVLESMTSEQQNRFYNKINESRKNGEITITMEITELQQAIRSSMSHSNMYDISYHLYAMLKLHFMINTEATNFIKQVKNNYTINIMTSGSLEHLDKILVASELKRERQRMITLEEMEEDDFRKELRSLCVEVERQGCGSGMSMVLENMEKGKKSLLAIHSSLVAYLSREDIRKMIRRLSAYCTYIIFFDCSQFQKQLCVASLFKIFPEHILLSNFAVDINLFRTSNLSISLNNKSAEPYATAAVSSYTNLEQFIKKESVRSISLTSIIIKNHIFKNQVLIGMFMMLTILVYQGGMFKIGQEFSSYFFVLFNWMLTILPLLYYMIGKPKLREDIVIEDYKDFRLKSQHVFGMVSGLMIAALTYLLTPDIEIQNIFISTLLNCTLISNLYYLVLDDSTSKFKQLVFIVIQYLLSAAFFIISSYFVPSRSVFYSELEILTPELENHYMYLIVTFPLIPIFITLWLFFLSFYRSVQMRDQRRKKHEEQEIQQIKQISTKNVIIDMSKSIGKQMRFRF